jgi:hypothetical protein
VRSHRQRDVCIRRQRDDRFGRRHQGLAHDGGRARRITHASSDRRGGELEQRRRRFVLAVPFRMKLPRRRHRFQIVDLPQHLRTGDAVDDAVVHLGEDRHAPAFESFEKTELPERSVASQGLACVVADEFFELLLAARLGQRGADDVAGELDACVDPRRMVEAERELDETATKAWKRDQAPHELGAHRIEIVAARNRRWIDDGHADPMHVLGRRFHVQESGVHAGQSLHRRLLPRDSPPAAAQRYARGGA